MTGEQNPTNTENCIFDADTDDLDAVLAQLTTEQLRFVVARQECATDREAARKIKVSESTVYRWPEVVKQAVTLMAQDGLKTALHIRRKNLAKAMLVKVKGLDSEDERIRQAASTEIIEWEMGKAEQTVKGDVAGVLVLAIGGVDPDEDI